MLVVFAAMLLGYAPKSTKGVDGARASLQTWDDKHKQSWLRRLKVEDLGNHSEAEREAIWAQLSLVPAVKTLASTYSTTMLGQVFEQMDQQGGEIVVALKFAEYYAADPTRGFRTVGDLKAAGEFTWPDPNDRTAAPVTFNFDQAWPVLAQSVSVNDAGGVDELARQLKSVVSIYEKLSPKVPLLNHGPWNYWTVESFMKLTDADCDAFNTMLREVDTALAGTKAPTRDRGSVQDYVRTSSLALNEESEKINSQRSRSMQIWDLKIDIPVDTLLLIFPGIFLLSEALVRALRAHRQARMIRLAAVERRLMECVGERFGGVAIGFECFTDTRPITYLVRLNWRAIFENNPNFFVEVFLTISSWAMAIYMATRGYSALSKATTGELVAVGTAIALGAAILVLSLLVSESLIGSVRRDADARQREASPSSSPAVDNDEMRAALDANENQA